MGVITTTLKKHSIAGNERIIGYFVSSAPAASGYIATPLSFVDYAVISPVSMTTAAYRCKVNLNDSSAASNGNVFLSSMTQGDDFFIVVYGRS